MRSRIDSCSTLVKVWRSSIALYSRPVGRASSSLCRSRSRKGPLEAAAIRVRCGRSRSRSRIVRRRFRRDRGARLGAVCEPQIGWRASRHSRGRQCGGFQTPRCDDKISRVRTSVYSIQDLEARLEEILESVRRGEHVVVCEEGRQVAEIRPIPEVPIDDGLRELLERGVIGPLVKPEGTLEPIAERPGALARFLESR